MGRWRTPGIRKAFDRWLEFVDVMLLERDMESKELAQQELLQELEANNTGRDLEMTKVEQQLRKEVQRRVDTCKRVVKRMLHHQLMLAWDSFVENVLTVKRNRETMRKVLARMTHRQVRFLPYLALMPLPPLLCTIVSFLLV